MIKLDNLSFFYNFSDLQQPNFVVLLTINSKHNEKVFRMG